MNNQKRRDKDDLKDEIRTALVSAFATCIICGLIALYSDRATTTIVAMIGGFGIILLLSAITAFFHFRRRKQLSPVTRDGIMDIIRFEGYMPKIDEDNDIVFKINGETHIVYFDGRKFGLLYKTSLPIENLQTAQAIASQITDEIIMAKLSVTAFPEREIAVLDVYLATFCCYEEELQRLFPIYIDIIHDAVARYGQKYEEVSSEPPRRNEIYQPEYRWLPDVVFKAVTEGHLAPEALTDEEWLRENIKNKISSVEMREEWDSFKINQVDNYGDYKLIVYQFPEPKAVPEAKYGAVLMNTTTLDIDYYTLEKTFNDKWVYGSMTPEQHRNYGEVDTDDLEKFIEWVFTRDKQLVSGVDYTKEGHKTVN